MAKLTINSEDVKLATETFGDHSNPAVLLIMGAMASMLWWPDEFCERIAASGRYVIRYDNRDTGLSTAYPTGEPGYTFADMAEDAIAILDGYGIETAHLVGMSLGGMIAQWVTLGHPDRVKTLTLISSSPLGIDGLPPFTEAYGEHAATAEAVDWSNRASVLDFMTRDARMVASTLHPHDAGAARRLVEQDLDRARSFASATNHFLLEGGDYGGPKNAADLSVSLLVIHGTSDPIFPIVHGEALVRAVSGSTLQRVEGGGHELHRGDWPQIVSAIVSHTGNRQ
ncbi:alpha/beta fold hydrolase [Rhizobium sullae]|uniref:Pimeloyl-ACP methyl ester carboxylesterase n=1 Tax=Rhizobium sullae TaxID=50338 RepID=A0A4R3Q3M0_RHISU|nr:alpha/beta hydrolase [Rhizobium sullae]TCU11915.1 pimeloyl-ACP methyl ester carboxylesterase [Rhizobium sullae]